MASGDGLAGPFIFIATFITIFFLLSAQGSVLLSPSEQQGGVNQYIRDRFDPSFLSTNTFWLNDTGGTGGYNITPGVEGSYFDHPFWHLTLTNADRFRFEEGGEFIELMLIRNNSHYDPNSDDQWHYEKDFWVAYSYWGSTREGWWVIPFSKILSSQVPGSQSNVHIDSTGESWIGWAKSQGMTFVVKADNSSGLDLTTCLYSNSGYTIFIVQSVIDDVNAQTNGWNLIVGLITFSLPGVPLIVNVIIVIPITFMLCYLTFRFLFIVIHG
jgi:hypothetical protein